MKLINKYYSSITVILVLSVLPLYIENAYFNVTDAKFHALLIAFAFVFPIMALTLFTKQPSCGHRFKKHLNYTGIFLIAFVMAAVISSLLSDDVRSSFFGTKGWCVGPFTYILLLAMYVYLTRYHVYSRKLWIAVYAVNAAVFVIGLFQFAGVDFFGFRENMVPKQLYQYISTFGNTNWFVGYLCLLIPLSFVYYLNSETRAVFAVNLVFLSCAGAVFMICISDGGYLGLGFSLFFLIPYIFGRLLRIKRSVLYIIILLAEAILIRLLPCYAGLMNKATGLSSICFNLKISVPALLFCIAIYLYILRVKEENIRLLCRIGICFEIVFTIIVTVFVVYTVLTFHDRWGSSRGLIWRISFENFSAYTLKEKLIGIGPELLRERYIEVQKVFENLAVKTSHSEPIQILLTTGVVGFVTWFGVCSSIAARFFRNVKAVYGDTDTFACFLPLTAYFAQSFVNSATISNLCLLFVIIAFFGINADKNVNNL